MIDRLPSPPRSGGRPGMSRSLAANVVFAFAALFTVAPAQAQAPTARIGYVDMKRLLDNAPQVRVAREALNREFAQRDAALKVQESRLEELRARQKRDSAIMPRDAVDALASEIDTLDRGIKRMRDKMREDLSARGNEELNKRWPEIHDAVIEYARENGYDLVVESPVIYASATIDITERVLERLQREFGARTPPP